MENPLQRKNRVIQLRCILKSLERDSKTTPDPEMRKLIIKDMQAKAFELQTLLQETQT